MTATRERNGVLIFVAPRAQKFAVIGDEGIHQRCGDAFWQQLVAVDAGTHFQAENFTDAVVHAIDQTGELLSAQHFPRRPDDRNELPNTVEEGRRRLWAKGARPQQRTAASTSSPALRRAKLFATCKLRDGVHSPSRSEFLIRCAVGPWVSVAGRETALARGNPALWKG